MLQLNKIKKGTDTIQQQLQNLLNSSICTVYTSSNNSLFGQHIGILGPFTNKQPIHHYLNAQYII